LNADACERIAGVREDLPPGEHVLWQGAPAWPSLARRAFHVREVAAYFALLTAVTIVSALLDGQAASAGLFPATLGAVACALLCALAWMSSRTTIYAITTRRVFLRVGIALPIAVNLPLHRIEQAQLALHGDGSGDLPLFLQAEAHLAYLHLWPHARPWRLRRPEPMMRSIADAGSVAQVLAAALQAAHGQAPEPLAAMAAAPQGARPRTPVVLEAAGSGRPAQAAA